MLGCNVDHVEIGVQPEDVGWNPDAAPSGDFETLCAAGYAMELILGRRPDVAWDSCRSDRAILKRIAIERTGHEMDQAEVTARFLEGVEHCRSILSHTGVRAVTDTLAESLGDAFLGKGDRLSSTEVRLLITPLIGLEVAHPVA